MLTVVDFRDQDSGPVGDKGEGLRELAVSELRVPPTVVLQSGWEVGRSEADQVLKALAVDSLSSLIIRPSMFVDRRDSSEVSGFFESRRVDGSLSATVDAMRLEYAREGALLHPGHPMAGRPTGYCLLVQEYILPAMSGVCHVKPNPGMSPAIEVGVTEGHLSALLAGRTSPDCSFEIELLDRIEDSTDWIMIGTEDDMTWLRKRQVLPDLIRMLGNDMAKLSGAISEAREIEWLWADDGPIYVQCQPLIT